jgi:hypothetical protein
MRRPRGGFEHRGDAHRPQATGTCTRRSRSAAEGGMPRGRGEARLHPNVRNRQTQRRAAWSVTAVHARPLDAPAPGPWSTAPSPTIERIGGRASPPSAHRMTVTHRQAALSGATVTPPEGWSDSAVEPTVRNQSRQQPRTSYAHGGTAAYLLDRQAKTGPMTCCVGSLCCIACHPRLRTSIGKASPTGCKTLSTVRAAA